jgi:hypothetical protein
MHDHKSAHLVHKKEQLDNKYVLGSCYADMKRSLYTHVHKFEIHSEFLCRNRPKGIFYFNVDLKYTYLLNRY